MESICYKNTTSAVVYIKHSLSSNGKCPPIMFPFSSDKLIWMWLPYMLIVPTKETISKCPSIVVYWG